MRAARWWRVGVLVAAGCGAAVFALAAFAGSGDETGSVITYTAAPGEQNVISVTDVAGNIRIQDTGTLDGNPIAVTPTGSCTPVASDTIDCPDGAATSLAIAMGDGNDSVTIGSSVDGNLGAITVDGGAGDDSITNNSTVVTTAS
jgi:hypothetical protein